MRLEKKIIKHPTFKVELEHKYVEAKQLSDDHKWAAALTLYNEILTAQQNEIGEDQRDCRKTLNDIVIVLMQMRENLLTSSSLNELFHIRKEALEVDTPEVVETPIYIYVLMEIVNQI